VKLAAIAGISILVAFALFGCSKSTDVNSSATDPLARSMAELDGRIEQHDRTLWANSTIEGRSGEMHHYRDDLDELFGHLGDTLSDREHCAMDIGEHHMGWMHGDTLCPSFDRMNDLHEEYHRHYEVMDSILHQYDGHAFTQEMDEHFQNMHAYMDSMMLYLDDEFGTDMMHGHDDDDGHGYGHGGH
jgi:hypothetical protein